MDDASVRASDAERERAVEALPEHLFAGRLTLEEFCERVGTALTARMTAIWCAFSKTWPWCSLAHRGPADTSRAAISAPGLHAAPAILTIASGNWATCVVIRPRDRVS